MCQEFVPDNRRRFDYDKNLLPNAYLRTVENQVTDVQSARARTGLSIGYPGYNLLYYTCLTSLRKNGFNTILETGTNLGFSTIILAQALHDSGFSGIIHTVEIDETNANLAQNNINNAGLAKLVKLHHASSGQFLSGFQPEGNLSFVFLDGNHESENVVQEFELLYNHFDDATVVFFDNTALMHGNDRRVNYALKQITQRYGGNIINFPNTSWSTPGQALWQKDYFREDWEI